MGQTRHVQAHTPLAKMKHPPIATCSYPEREGDVAVVVGARSSTAPRADHYWCIPPTTTTLPHPFGCGVLKKVDSGTGKLGYGFTDSVH